MSRLSITLGYTVDIAAPSWQTKTYKVSMYKLWGASKVEANWTESHERTLRQAFVRRLMIDLELDFANFTDTVDPNFTAWNFVSLWSSMPYKRLYIAATSVFGFTQFATANNTNYVVQDRDPEYDIQEEYVKNAVLHLVMAKEL